MTEQREFFPTPKGLKKVQLEQLGGLAEAVQQSSLSELQHQAEEHVERARQAHAKNPFINARFAEAIGSRIGETIQEWDGLPAAAQYWFRGAIQYFVHSCDGEPDFASVIGFDDDAEVLNACLRLAGKHDWCLKPEDFDHA